MRSKSALRRCCSYPEQGESFPDKRVNPSALPFVRELAGCPCWLLPSNQKGSGGFHHSLHRSKRKKLHPRVPLPLHAASIHHEKVRDSTYKAKFSFKSDEIGRLYTIPSSNRSDFEHPQVPLLTLRIALLHAARFLNSPCKESNLVVDS